MSNTLKAHINCLLTQKHLFPGEMLIVIEHEHPVAFMPVGTKCTVIECGCTFIDAPSILSPAEAFVKVEWFNVKTNKTAIGVYYKTRFKKITYDELLTNDNKEQEADSNDTKSI